MGEFSRFFFKVFLLSMFTAGVVAAQTIPPQAYVGMRWRLVGPFRAGRSIAAAGIPGNPSTFYMGTVDGGMWKTVNAGVTWEPISDGQVSPSIGALAIAPSDSRIMYVGTGEADLRSDNTHGDGMYKSTDGGSHWTHIGLKDTRHIGRVLVDPHDPNLVLVAALGHAYGPNEERGVYRTTDGGLHWTNVLHRSPDVGAIDLASDPSEPSIIYATLYQTRRPAWSQYQPNDGPGSGLFKSTDEGLTWSEITGGGLPAKPYGRIGIAVANNSRGAIVYALMDAGRNGTGLYRSDNGGSSWTLQSKDPNVTSRMWYFAGVTVDPNDANTVYTPNRSLARSTDGGRTFTVIKGSPGGDDYHFLWIDPADSRRMIVASDQGTVVSLDGGATWSSWYNQPTGQFYHIITDNQFPYRIYGAQQDAGTAGIDSRSDYGSITFRNWNPVGAGESGYIAPDPLHPNIIFGGNSGGEVFRFDQETGQTHVVTPWLLSEFGTPRTAQKYRFNWTSPLVFDRHDRNTLYLGAQMVLRTTDGGLHWQELGPDLTRAQKNRRSESGPPTMENAAERGWGVVYTIASSPVRKNLLWAGTDDGLIHISRDGGKRWTNVTPKGLSAWSKISVIDASPFDAGEAYAAVDRHRLDDQGAYIYKTRDYGKHWTRADQGIPTGSFVRAVRSDLTKRGLLYAGTETGVFVSFDDGAHWQSLNLNLPTVAVRDLSVHGNDLVAGTHGRAIWILDDLTLLQQLSAKVLAEPAHLFKPQTAIRIRRSENSDTPLPPEEPQGVNPPSGAIIDYALKSAPQSPISLEIRDEAGNLVRRYSSDDQRPEDSGVYFTDEWLPRFSLLPTNPGHNRFVWNLHYATPPAGRYGYTIAAIAGQGTVLMPQGPLAPPGTYTITLTVNNHSYKQKLDVVMDPRIHVGTSVLHQQLNLAIRVWNAMADQFALTAAVDSVHHQLIALNANKTSGMPSNLSSLDKTVAGIQRSLRGLRFSSLETDVMSADREPTQQMKDAYATLKAKLDDAGKKWRNFSATGLQTLNKQLSQLEVSQVIVPATAATHLNAGPQR